MEDILYKVYIDLDSLLDTRLSTLYMIDESIVDRVFKDDYYFKRYYDEFDIVSNNIFTRLYKSRNKHVLKFSYLTRLVSLLFTELELLNSKLVMSNSPEHIVIDINTYPYKLTKKESDIYKLAMKSILLIDTIEVNMIYKDVKELTLSEVGSKYNFMFMYDAVRWLDHRLSYELSPDAIYTRLYGPALLLDGLVLDSSSTFEKLLESQVKLYEPYINYLPLEVSNFCLTKKEI